LTKLSDALKNAESSRRPSRGGGGGGGSRTERADNELDFSWVEGWVSSIADTANSLISRDFADKLVSGSSKEISEAFQALLDKAFELKIDQLPAFQSLLNQLRSKFSQLANLADTRDLLKDQIDDANKALGDFKDTLSDVRKEAEKFNVSSGLTSPTLSLLDQARAAQDKYDELYQKAEGLKASRASFLSTVEGAVNQPLSGRNPLSQTRKLLTQAKTFRDNLLALREKGFGPDVIRQVAEAGIVDGSNIAKGLLSLTGTQMAEFVQMRQQIQTIATEAGGIAADVLFGTDIADAEKALNTQRSLVAQLFTSAVTEAEANVSRQQGIVDGLNTQLNATEVAIRDPCRLPRWPRSTTWRP